MFVSENNHCLEFRTWCIFACFNTQAQQYNVQVYIAGFVIGVAPLFVTVLSPIIGYFVSAGQAAT